MAKVHDMLGKWQGSQHILAIQKAFRAQNKQMTAIEYISTTVEVNNVSCSIIQQDVAAACKLWERSPLVTALSSKDLPGGQTPV
jgi:hypothetical protein